jgi:hypothetical protein
MQGPTEWRITADDMKALHARCKVDGIAVVIGIVSYLPRDRTRASIGEFQSVMERDLGLKANVVLTLSNAPTPAEVRAHVDCLLLRVAHVAYAS